MTALTGIWCREVGQGDGRRRDAQSLSPPAQADPLQGVSPCTLAGGQRQENCSQRGRKLTRARRGKSSRAFSPPAVSKRMWRSSQEGKLASSFSDSGPPGNVQNGPERVGKIPQSNQTPAYCPRTERGEKVLKKTHS